MNCVARIIPFFTELYKPVLKYLSMEQTQTEAFQFIWTLTETEPKFETAVEPKPNLNRKN